MGKTDAFALLIMRPTTAQFIHSYLLVVGLTYGETSPAGKIPIGVPLFKDSKLF
jgi:hypothetical protein